MSDAGSRMPQQHARDRRRVLLVDDQPANIEVLAAALEDSFDLYFATCGSRALDICVTTDIDLVLLDVMMPGLDGYEVCRRLKSEDATRDIPVIFVTALGDVGDETTGFAIGGVDYITKPVRTAVVRARVRTHIELKEQRDLLSALASTDGLTGIANRRLFDKMLDYEWQRAVRSEAPLSLLLLDIDFFKQFNDTYGHARGDQCLRDVAGALTGCFQRSTDCVARFGGEEFVASLPDTGAAAAAAAVAASLERIRGLKIPHAGSAVADYVSASIGAVTVRAAPELMPLRLVELADERLYQAKGDGRNRGVHLDLDSGVSQTIVPTPAAEGRP